MMKRILVMLIFTLTIMGGILFNSNIAYAAGRTYNLGAGWEMRVDTPGMDAKNYHHIHFYYNKAQKYCLRLDTLQPCDGYGGNPLPRWVMKSASQIVGKNLWGYAIPTSTIGWGKALAVVGCALLVIIATICPFDGPAGDAIAWGILLGVI